MKKYRFEELCIEITRRCNEKCVHCFRGDAQDVSMSPEIIDRIFEDVQDVNGIIFGNGEVILEVERILYFIDKLVGSRWSTRAIWATTNGTLCEPTIIDAFEKFCLWGPGKRATLRISNDQYHDSSKYVKAYEFYKPLVEAANERIKSRYPENSIELKYVLWDGGHLPALIYSGRAVELIKMNIGTFRRDENTVVPFCYKRRIKIVNDWIPCSLQISADGSVVFTESVSYEQMDELAIGNILHQNLSELIDKHNEACPVLCSEMELLYRVESRKHIGDDSLKNIRQILERIYKGIVGLRYSARRQFPHIPAQIIIERIPFPNAWEVLAIIVVMYQHSPYYTENLIANIKKHKGTPKEQIYMDAMYRVVLLYLKDERTTRKYPYWMFGTEKEITEALNKRLGELDAFYEDSPELATNGKIFSCEPDERNTINYSEEVSENDYIKDDMQIAVDVITKVLMD